jgi:hypothetical protein
VSLQIELSHFSSHLDASLVSFFKVLNEVLDV